MDDDELADYLTAYAEVCNEIGVEPLPKEALAVLAEALLTGNLSGAATLH